MASPDPSDRFGYLFEPLDDENTMTTEVTAVDSVVPDGGGASARLWRPLPVVGLGAALVGVALLTLSRPADVTVVPEPVGSTVQTAPSPIVTSSPIVESPSEAAPIPSIPPAPPSAAAPPFVAPEPRVPQGPAPAASPRSPQPGTRPPSAPALRAPMSASPEPRPPFPHQRTPDGDHGPGGLLGRLGL